MDPHPGDSRAAGGAPPPGPRRKLMAIASGGGHWVQLRRIMPAFEGFDVFYASVGSAPSGLGDARYYAIPNATRRDRRAFADLAWQLARIVLRERPDVVITTGAAPGLVALALAKLLVRSRTVWIDSIANVERLSSSGARARPVADVWLTQWEHLSRPDGPEFWGAVL